MNDTIDFRYESATCAIKMRNRRGWVERVYSKDRGKGHARALLKRVITWADINDIELRLRVRGYGGPTQTMLSNRQLVEFYRSLGFVEIDIPNETHTIMSRRKNTPYSEREY